MGKATRWLRGLFGMKKGKERESERGKEQMQSSDSVHSHKFRSFGGKASSENQPNISNIPGNVPLVDPAWIRSYMTETEKEQNKHAIAVAAATAAAADAAVAAAQAAVAVVRLTSNGRVALLGGARERRAAVKIQTVFRGYLARKALRALKGLVKIQALVRGYLVRKSAAATLHSMEALLRAQTAVRNQRLNRSLNMEKRFQPRKSIERFHDSRSEIHSKRLSASVELNSSYDESSPKIVEIDTYKPRSRSRRMNVASSECGDDFLYQKISSPIPIPSFRNNVHDFDWCFTGDECKFSTAQTTPRVTNYISSFAPPTPAKSVCGDHCFRPNYANAYYPNYMANTQSFKAKLRSQSAPRQRPELGSRKRLSLDEIMAARNSISGIRMQRSSCSQFQEAMRF